METRLEELLTALTEKGIAMAKAKDHAAQLADQHSVLKELAIIRVMERDGISSNAAKDIVRSDPAFMEHCTEQRNAGVAVIRAETEYQVAKLRATQASLITLSTTELQATVADLTQKLKVSKRETDLREMEKRKANRYLSDRICDVERFDGYIKELQAENAKLREGILAKETKIPDQSILSYRTLEESKESLTAEPYSAEATA